MATSFNGYRSLIEKSSDAISLVDPNGAILYGSASTMKLFGYQPDEIVGRNCLELIHPEDRAQSQRALNELVAGTASQLRWDARVLHRDGKYSWVESTASNLLSETEVQAIVVQHRDINARKALEAEKQQSLDELARSNLRLEEFAYTAAHDLREPLRAIHMYTQLLARTGQLDERAQHMCDFILNGSERMSTLIDDLLLFASTGVHEAPRPVDLEHTVAQASQNLSLELAASGAAINVAAMPVVLGNEIHLVRLFQNLISNAIKYRSIRPIKINISATRQDGHWMVGVADNCVGIPEKDLERVFMPFVRRAKRDVPGTGLGLAVCKKIVEGLGGKIWIESKRNEGSIVYFTIQDAAEPLQ